MGAARALGAALLVAAVLLLATADADFRTTHELIEQHGYPVEMHQVVTEDGYVLNMHRIPHSARRPATPVDDDHLQRLENERRDGVEQRKSKRSGDDEAAPMRRLSIHEYLDPCQGEAKQRSPSEQNTWTTAGNARTSEGRVKTEKQRAWKAKMDSWGAQEKTGSGKQNTSTVNDSFHTVEGNARMVEQRTLSTDGRSSVAVEGSLQSVEGNARVMEHREWPADGKRKTPRPAILLQHGVLASSLDWVLTGPGKALGYKLSDAGYDVWLGNLRGTFYSRGHVNMTADDPAYWNYSWNEIGVYDLAAMVDHVLRATGQNQLHFVGHSMGATVAVVLLSERPEYNDKLKVTVLLAPVVRLRYNTSVFRHYSSIWSALQKVTSYSGMHGFPPDPPMLHRRLAPVCRERYIGQGICANILHTVAGYASNINNTLLPMLFGHYPSQTSIRTLAHFLQGMNTGNFSKFDFGGENMQRYRQPHPPDYGVSRITSVTAIFYGDSDPFTSTEDVSWLAGELPNLVHSYRVPSHAFSHLSFLWAADVDKVLYEPLLRLLNRQLRH